MIALPVPSLTATIHPPGAARHALGRVVVNGYAPPMRTAAQVDDDEDAGTREDRVDSPHRCARCVSAGLSGVGHTSRNAACPARGALTAEQAATVAVSRARVPVAQRRGQTTRSRCAARYARLVGCSLVEAAREFGISGTAARLGWAEVYPDVPIVRGIGGGTP